MPSPDPRGREACASYALFPALLLVLSLAPTVLAQDEHANDESLHRAYGFDGLIISAFNDGLFGLRAGDVSGDGVADLAVVNNGKARIELLVHRGADEPVAEEQAELLNELPDEVFFRRRSLPTEQKVWALELADLDGDGRHDVITSGDSGRLTIVYSEPDGEFSDALSLPLADGSPGASSLAVGDLDGDGRLDVAALAKDQTLLFLADAPRSLAPAAPLPNAGTTVDALHLLDADGDGMLDLLYVVHESETPLRLRPGLGGGRFGPELRTPLPPLRSHAVADVDGDGSAEVLAVARRSGRAMIVELAHEEAGRDLGDVFSAPLVSPLPGAARRTPVLADVDGDGLLDLLVAEPAAARLVVHRGGAEGRFGGALAYPALLGSDWPSVVDLDGDGLPEIVLGAPDEQALGLAQVDARGAIAFPEIAGAPGGEVAGLALGDLDGDGRLEIWVAVSEGRGRKREHVLKRFVDGKQTLAYPLADLPADPSGLVLVDLDRDGRVDVIVTVPTEPPRLLLSTGGEPPFRQLDAEAPGLGILKGVDAAALVPLDVDGDGALELLVPSANFARALYLDGDGGPRVVAQFNLDRPGAKVSAATVADLDGDGRREVLLLDPTVNELVLLSQDTGGAHEVGRVTLAELSPERLLPADLDGDGDDDLVLWGKQQFATLLSGGERTAFRSRVDYESPVKDAFLTELAAGDVNGDGGTDLVLLETSKHLVHVVDARAGRLRHALRFPVYEARMFESSRRSSREPRELVIADVTGDGWLDVALLVHDRLIVYPQEPPR